MPKNVEWNDIMFGPRGGDTGKYAVLTVGAMFSIDGEIRKLEEEVWRLRAEDAAWDKHSLVAIINERNELRTEVEQLRRELTEARAGADTLRKILDRIILRRCGTCKWFCRYADDSRVAIGYCQHKTPVTPTREYFHDDHPGALVDDTCRKWQHRDAEIAAALDCAE